MSNPENHQDESTSVDEVAEPPSSPLRRSPGGMLMAQRETLELSLQQVADQLHLTMHFVRAIESDSYEKLPGDVFVRGYIRTYARLLRLDPDQVLMIYDEFNSHKIARKEEAIKRRDRRRKDRNRPWVLVSGVAFVSVAVALWYLSPGQSSDNVADAASEAELLVVARLAIEASTAVADVQIRPERPVSEQTLDEITPVIVNEASGALAIAGTDAVSTQGLEQLLPEQPAAAQTATGMEPAASGRTSMEYWSGMDELRLAFGADSAVQIEHNGGAENHEHLYAAGETLVIRGTAPFSVLLGDARNVSLNFNGRHIDISSNIRVDNSARLSIGM
jgi:cytoskeleton protein RodZ